MENKPWWQNGLAFECQQCGSCCAGPDEGYIWVNHDEIQAMADHLGIPVKDFKTSYCRRVGLRQTLIEKEPSKDCVFLPGKDKHPRGCEVYSVRPSQCRTWPFWKENLASIDDWRQANIKCPGIDRGQWHSAERIAAILHGETSPSQTTLPVIEAATQWLRNNPQNLKALAAVEQIYRDLETHLTGLDPWCKNCGLCCDFDRYDHRLYVTTLEMLFLLKGISLRKDAYQKTARPGVCPYQQQDGCALRPYRSASCRIFFCQSLEPAFQNELTEQVLQRLRQLHQQFDAVYCYADLQEWLRALNLPAKS